MAQQQIIYRVQNDTGPDEEFTITRDGEIVDLPGYTVRFGIKSLTTTPTRRTRPALSTPTPLPDSAPIALILATYRILAATMSATCS